MIRSVGAAVLALASQVFASEGGAGPSLPQVPPVDPKVLLTTYEKEIKPLLAKNCFQCHGEGKKKGGLTLDEPLTLDVLQRKTQNWIGLHEQVQTDVMPPEEATDMPKADKEAILKWVATAIATADANRPKDPGFVSLHRLNRTEYNNTIRDLTGIDFDPANEFPADDSGYGFDNIADVLTMSPTLAEKYIGAAEAVVERIVTDKEKGSLGSRRLTTNTARLKGGVSKDRDRITFGSIGDATYTMSATPNAEYNLHIRAWQDAAGPDPAEMIVRLDGTEVAKYKVTTGGNHAKRYTTKLKATAATMKIAIAFPNDFWDEKAPSGKKDRNLFANEIELETLSSPAGIAAAKVFIAVPSQSTPETACADKILRSFATRAFRRPVKDAEMQSLMKIYTTARKELAFERAIAPALMAVLVSPSFIFRVEGKPATVTAATANSVAAWELSDHEIATRLSYFLWSTMPDEALLAAASEKKLRDPKGREEQVKRMLKDPRSRQLVENFAGQWLELRNLDEISRNYKLFPMFNLALADSMAEEAVLFFESVLQEDKPLFTLIDADYTFVNEPLAKIYGIKDVKGDDFKRVSTKDTPRGGVLTMSSTLTLTANPARTSPVKRGKWVLDQILGSPPPPAPPEVPTLVEKSSDELGKSLRERLETHRSNPACAACHNRMDGLGFALENFDSVGRWRDADGKFPIDSSGTLPGEKPFKGAKELKALIMNRKDAVARTFIEKMFTFALGRGVKPYDRVTLGEIQKYVQANDHRISSVVLGIVQSDAFIRRRDKRGDE